MSWLLSLGGFCVLFAVSWKFLAFTTKTNKHLLEKIREVVVYWASPFFDFSSQAPFGRLNYYWTSWETSNECSAKQGFFTQEPDEKEKAKANAKEKEKEKKKAQILCDKGDLEDLRDLRDLGDRDDRVR